MSKPGACQIGATEKQGEAEEKRRQSQRGGRKYTHSLKHSSIRSFTRSSFLQILGVPVANLALCSAWGHSNDSAAPLLSGRLVFCARRQEEQEGSWDALEPRQR